MLTGGTMPDPSSSSTLLEDLPEEILVDGILPVSMLTGGTMPDPSSSSTLLDELPEEVLVDGILPVSMLTGGTVPDPTSSTQLEDLPEEILVDGILLRLPSKDVGRCRAVCTTWRAATSTPEFMLKHHRRQPSLPIIDWKRRPHTCGVLTADAGASIGTTSCQPLWPFLRLPGAKEHQRNKKKNKNELHAACDGFIIVYRLSQEQYYICNPVTRKHALLPQPQDDEDMCNNLIGFYRYHPTGEYKLLWLSPQLNRYAAYILTVGFDAKPRDITPTGVNHQLLLARLIVSFAPAYHRGSLHWCPLSGSQEDIVAGGADIIAFDTEAESFRWMRGPAQLCRSRHSKLFNLEGTLAFWGASTPSFTTMDVWVMQDYKAEIWAPKYRIDVSMLEASRQLYLTSLKDKMPLDSTVVQQLGSMAVLNERELLIMFNEKHVLHCGIDGTYLGNLSEGKYFGKTQYCRWFTGRRLQETLAPIPCPEMPAEDDEEDPFSMGCV